MEPKKEGCETCRFRGDSDTPAGSTMICLRYPPKPMLMGIRAPPNYRPTTGGQHDTAISVCARGRLVRRIRAGSKGSVLIGRRGFTNEPNAR